MKNLQKKKLQKKKPLLLRPYVWVLLSASTLALADPMGATDAGILATLKASLAKHAKSVELLVKRLKQEKENLDLAQKMADWEELSQLRELAGTGSEMRRIVAGLYNGQDSFFRLINYPYQQINAMREDLVELQEQAKRAGDDPILLDRIDRMGAVLERTDNVAVLDEAIMLGKINRLKKGQTEGEAIRDTSHNVAIMAELMVGREKEQLAQEARALKGREAANQMTLGRSGAFKMYGGKSE